MCFSLTFKIRLMRHLSHKKLFLQPYLVSAAPSLHPSISWAQLSMHIIVLSTHPHLSCWTMILPKQGQVVRLPGWLNSKESTCNAEDVGDAVGLIPGSGRSPGGGHGNPVQYSCLETPMDGRDWRVHRVAQSQTRARTQGQVVFGSGPWLTVGPRTHLFHPTCL